ncbi:platelet-derived growth factor subunit B [Spea bombifrons]|uniref:platelet-derived growth factor subunit B n=1 Tax=Spea bombifrons TaxID=233779 RepID=UPI00234AE0A6|nr:platelet-derived growth factor subunit B [Spea bombifrons]
MNFRGLLVSLWFLHVVRAEGDPIPEEMYEKIASGSVKSISDIQRLLQIDSVDVEEDVNYASRNETRGFPRANSSHSRVIRSLDVEMAALAECKTRTEVYEISRQLVDSNNANFLIYPSCVEVQRCSGCCISMNYRCVPSRIHIRHVKVKKIIIARPRNKIEMATVPLEDHMECRCEAVHIPAARSQPIHHEAKGTLDIPATTLPPAPVSRKEPSPQRLSKRKNRKFKHMPSKKEQMDLLVT